MKYFLDTEFIEGFHKPLFGKRRHFLDLISIGIVCEDGREYYAISNEFSPKHADNWVRENVISQLPDRSVDYHDSPRRRQESLFWKSNRQISNEILAFVYPDIFKNFHTVEKEFYLRTRQYGWNTDQPEFYGYFADYDWVLFCSLFGRMIDLPKGFPMYCRDLKQMADEQFEDYFSIYSDNGRVKFNKAKEKDDWIAAHFPQQENEHSALDDAIWNKKLYEYLNTKQ